MTIQYKNQGFSLTTTGTTSILTSPANGRCLVKQIQVHQLRLELIMQLLLQTQHDK